ncbi:hypothetical protein BH11PSE10_BH11PSE10_04400 [soil metagenome]
MANSRLPGPLCTVLGALQIDVGTLCRAASAQPSQRLTAHPHPSSMRQRVSPAAAAPRPAPPASALAAGRAATKLSDADFEAAAAQLGKGIASALLRAFAEVESGGKSGFGASGLPIIAYEGHVFRKYTHRQHDDAHPYLSYKYLKKAGPQWQHNNKDQATAWATLGAAMALDHDAALLACSWGMFQVMGFNFEACGYADVDAFVAAMKAGQKGQLLAFVGYCKKKKGMVAALQAKDFAKMAALYNGEDYGDYDRRIEKAYKKHGGR